MKNTATPLEEKLTLFGFLILGAISATYISKLILPLTRNYSTWIHTILVILIGVFLFVQIAKFIRNTFPDSIIGSNLQDMTSELGVFFLALAVVGMIDKGSNEASFCVDNGTDAPITISANHKDQQIVEAGSFLKLDLPMGKNDLNIAGRDTTVDINQRQGHYIYNCGAKNSYLLNTVLYGEESQVNNYKDTSSLQIISNQLFFYTKADYLFEEDKTILTSKSDRGKVISKKVLLRMNDFMKRIEEEAKESPKETSEAK
jgi:hypothetical protein